MAELVVKYRLNADGLLVNDLIAERDFLAQRLGIPEHLLQVLSWGDGTSKCCVLGKCAHNCFFTCPGTVCVLCVHEKVYCSIFVCLHVCVHACVAHLHEDNTKNGRECIQHSYVFVC